MMVFISNGKKLHVSAYSDNFLSKRILYYTLKRRGDVEISSFRISFRGAKAPSGPRRPHRRGFTFKLNYTPRSVKILWLRDRPVTGTPITDNQQHSQERQTFRPTITESEGLQTHA